MSNGNSGIPEPPLPARAAPAARPGAPRPASPGPARPIRVAPPSPGPDFPAILRTIPSPRALIFAVGALLGLVMFLAVMRRGDPLKHVRAFGEVATVPAVYSQPSPESAGAVAFSEGKAAYEAKDWAKAASAFDMAATEDSRLAEARLYQGIALLAAKRPEDSLQALDAYVQGSWRVGAMPLDAAFYFRAKALCAQGKGFEARDALHECVGQGGMMVEDCVRAMKGLENNLLKLPRPKNVPPAFPPGG